MEKYALSVVRKHLVYSMVESGLDPLDTFRVDTDVFHSFYVDFVARNVALRFTKRGLSTVEIRDDCRFDPTAVASDQVLLFEDLRLKPGCSSWLHESRLVNESDYIAQSNGNAISILKAPRDSTGHQPR